MRKLRHVPILFFLLLAGRPAKAASLSGRVNDATGKPVPQARVSIFARDRQDRITVVTGGDGQYHAEALPSGEYLIEADAPGMAPSGAHPLTIGASDSVTLDLKLDVAAIHTDVLVTATGAAQSTGEIAKSVDSFRSE